MLKHELQYRLAPREKSSERFSVASAGDVNGDGYPDVVVGAPLYDGAAGADSGKAFVYLGSAEGPSLAPGWSAEGELAGSRFGSAVASVGDMNGDGFGDVAVGAPGFSDPDDLPFRFSGRIYVYLGSAGGLSPTPAVAVDGRGYDLGFTQGLGGSLTSGDFNGDGFSDVLAGQYARYTGRGVSRRCRLELQRDCRRLDWQGCARHRLLSNNQATAVLEPQHDAIFADGFESGDLSAWSPRTGRGVTVTTAAALEGGFGLEVAAPAKGSAAVQDDTPLGEVGYRARFRFDPNGFSQIARRGAAARRKYGLARSVSPAWTTSPAARSTTCG